MCSRGLNERALIAGIFAPLAANTPGAFNLTDDAACLNPPAGKDIIMTTDMSVAGVHFLPHDPADTIAAKALRVNLSDLAAKGAVPLGYTLCLALNEGCSVDWIRNFAGGLLRDQQTYKILLYGGDTVKTPGPMSISIMAFGTVDKGRMVKRAGAKPGDYIYVTGTIGDGALGLGIAQGDKNLSLESLSEDHKNYLLQRYRCPEPRCDLVPAVAKFAHGAMDVSDGLLGDMQALASVSGVSADINLYQIPLSPAVRALVAGNETLLRRALNGGDDYEIICTIAPERAEDFEALARRCGVPVGRIGVITTGEQPIRILDEGGNQVALTIERFEH